MENRRTSIATSQFECFSGQGIRLVSERSVGKTGLWRPSGGGFDFRVSHAKRAVKFSWQLDGYSIAH